MYNNSKKLDSVPVNRCQVLIKSLNNRLKAMIAHKGYPKKILQTAIIKNFC